MARESKCQAETRLPCVEEEKQRISSLPARDVVTYIRKPLEYWDSKDDLERNFGMVGGGLEQKLKAVSPHLAKSGFAAPTYAELVNGSPQIEYANQQAKALASEAEELANLKALVWAKEVRAKFLRMPHSQQDLFVRALTSDPDGRFAALHELAGKLPDTKSLPQLGIGTVTKQDADHALKATNGNKTQAAKVLGISRAKMRRLTGEKI